ncbi:Cysteine-rich repeat secretory protein 55, partial [Bienertia sinuspersici]
MALVFHILVLLLLSLTYSSADNPSGNYCNKNTIIKQNPGFFNQELGIFFDEIISKAVKPSSGGLRKDKKKLSNFETLYALVQCIKDLSPVSCSQCLAIAIQNFEGFCSNSKGCR